MFALIRALTLSALCILLLVTASRNARACSVCLAGDPNFSAQGTSAQQIGDFSVFLQAQGWKKESGVLPGEHQEEEGEDGEGKAKERNTSQRLDLYLSWTPLDRVTFTLDVPWAFNEIEEIEGGQSETFTHAGLADISLQSSVVLWRNRDVLPTTWLEGRAFLKAPTGQRKKRVGGVRDPHLQVGTGSWDYGFGLAGAHRLEWASLYASVFYRINTGGALDYEYGDVALANAAIEVPLGHAFGVLLLDPLTPGLELNYRWAAQDKFEGQGFRDSGGSIVYLTPSLRVTLPWAAEGHRSFLRGAVQVPLATSSLNGFQDEDPIWFVGIGYAF